MHDATDPSHADALPTEAMIATLVHAFYDKVRSDALLAPVFAARLDGHWDEHLTTMVDFWSSVLLTTGRYRGRPLALHDQLEQLTPAMPRRWLTLFAETAHAHCPPPIARLFIERAEQIAVHLFGRRRGTAGLGMRATAP